MNETWCYKNTFFGFACFLLARTTSGRTRALTTPPGIKWLFKMVSLSALVGRWQASDDDDGRSNVPSVSSIRWTPKDKHVVSASKKIEHRPQGETAFFVYCFREAASK